MIGDLLLFKSFYGRFYDTLFYFLHKGLVGERYRRNRTHTACIESSIPFAYTLIVLSGWKNLIALPIGQNKAAEFYSLEELLNNYFLASYAKFLFQ